MAKLKEPSKSSVSRREFAVDVAALGLTALLPRAVVDASAATQRVIVRTDAEIGMIHPELHGQFAEHLGSCIYGGLWVNKASRIPNVDGYRQQAIAYLRELEIPVLRWPGGCFADDYHWRDGVGAASRRPKRVNIHWGGYVEDNSFGIHEFIGLCRKIGAEPYLTGNVGSGSPEEFRDWIEYCNYPSGSSLAEERATNGSPEPFRVRYWGVGNENWGCGGEMTPAEYAAFYRRFSVYARTFGGLKPFLIACGPASNDLAWTRGFMEGVSGRRLPDGFSMHYYSGGNSTATNYTPSTMEQQLASFAAMEQAIIQQRGLLDGFDSGRNVGLVIDEWGVWDRAVPAEEKQYGALWQQSTLRSALAAGMALNVFNRQADKLYMCNIAQMVNVLQSLLLTDGPEGERCIRTTTYYTYALFKPHRSRTSLRVETEDSSPLGLSASASVKGAELILSLVNPKLERDLTVECSLRRRVAKEGKAQILHDADFNACNSFDQPGRIVPRPCPVSVEGSKIRLDLPAMSVATVILQLA